MADNEEALELRRRARRRLVGAFALVLALVIVPPWIMDLEPKPVVTNLTVEIPKQGSARLKPPASPPAAAATTPDAAPSAQREGASAAEAKPDPTQSGDAATRDVPKAAMKPETVARATPTPDAAQKEAEANRAEAILNAESYVVPLGTFASKENVKQVETKLAKAGVKFYTESLLTANGQRTRVRAGPFESKTAAESTRDQLKSLGLDPGPVAARQNQ